MEQWEGIERIDFEAGHSFFTEGEEGFFFYVVQAGQVEIFKTDHTGKKKTLGIVGPGQALGEFALITNSPRSASAQALTVGYAYRVSEEVYKKLLADLPSWAVAVFESLIQRLRQANEMITEYPEDKTEEYTLVEEITDRLLF